MMLMMALVLALPALAQEDPTAISREWLTITGESQRNPDKASTALKAEVAKSEAATRKLAMDKTAYLCANRAKYDSDPEAVAKYIADWDAEFTAIHAAALAKIPAKDRAALSANVAEIKSVGPTTQQTLDNIRSGVLDLKVVLDAYCNPPARPTKEESPKDKQNPVRTS